MGASYDLQYVVEINVIIISKVKFLITISLGLRLYDHSTPLLRRIFEVGIKYLIFEEVLDLD